MKKSVFLALVLAVSLGDLSAANAQQTAQPGAQVQQPPEGGVDWGNVGYGALTALADVVYVPAKLVYAGLGGITGGAAYGLTGGNRETADTIWRSSFGGDYVLTPPMIKGDQPIYFSGPTQTPQPDAAMQPPPAQMGMSGSSGTDASAAAGSGSVGSYAPDAGAGPVSGTGPVTGKHSTYFPPGKDIE